MHTLFACLFALCALFLSALAMAIPDNLSNPPHPPWEQVYIKAFNYTGDACPPPDSIGAKFTNSGNVSYLEVAFDSTVIKVRPGQPSVDTRNCSLSFDVHFPANWTLTLNTLDILGDMDLDPDVQVEIYNVCRWDGQPGSWFFAYTWEGGDDKIPFKGSEPLDSLCNGAPSALLIDSKTTMYTSQNIEGSGATTANSSKIIHQYGCEWTKC
ncbi:hypothetical protein L211DRAFT_845046 [Terfezia boudieri ATCC MYA-4762]|uniref:Ubiquitin 3 binding protein But2 C-terminal domain-containing protein n=1 Tax=Terfezia boudieri ATCC MYA-4762 TaxID=1051890 RepID=A0A3N4M5C5_9PEZI|nr:hypothetical protein L211DRAFT_845046 [Terfezia boudieri ATCC MYA-4762]